MLLMFSTHQGAQNPLAQQKLLFMGTYLWLQFPYTCNSEQTVNRLMCTGRQSVTDLQQHRCLVRLAFFSTVHTWKYIFSLWAHVSPVEWKILAYISVSNLWMSRHQLRESSSTFQSLLLPSLVTVDNISHLSLRPKTWRSCLAQTVTILYLKSSWSSLYNVSRV